jgi:hypothetical protein
MPVKYLRNANRPWTALDDRRLRALALANTPTRVIGLKLGRSELAVRARASLLGISLRPVNQSPYNRRPR